MTFFDVCVFNIRKLQSSLFKFQTWSWFYVASVSNALAVYVWTLLCCHSKIYQIAMMGDSAKPDNNFTFNPPQKNKCKAKHARIKDIFSVAPGMEMRSPGTLVFCDSRTAWDIKQPMWRHMLLMVLLCKCKLETLTCRQWDRMTLNAFYFYNRTPKSDGNRTIRTSWVTLSNSYRKFVDESGCCKKAKRTGFNIHSRAIQST